MPIRLNSTDWQVTQAVASRGRKRGVAAATTEFPSAFLTPESSVEEAVTIEPKPAARGAAAAPGALDLGCDLDPGEAAVLAVRHPSGALTFHAAVEVTRPSRGGRGQARFVVQVPSAGGDGATRGFVSHAIKAILIKVGKVTVDKAVQLVLPHLARAFETVTWKEKGLEEGWLKVSKDALAANKLVAGSPSSTDRSLLFIHGTFSNAASAYGPLAKSDFFDRVKPLYGDRMFAFDHFTVSRTPDENARMLLTGLPDRTFTFDVITHSRGGLVLRSLVERAPAIGPLASRFKLGRAVLVASPNEGTPLATPKRWEDTVGWIANLLELFPENPFTTGAEFVANGLVWLARHASGDLPGIRAMDGDGTLIEELQGPPGPPSATYSALVANYNPTANVLQRMVDTGVDQFFGSANDLVVPSEGGWRIDRSGSTFIPASRIGCFGPGGNLPVDSVTHVSFFSQPATVSFLATALSGQPQPLAPVDPAKALPDRRLLRSGAPGISAPIVSTGNRPKAGARARLTEEADRRKMAAERASTDAETLRVSVVNGNLTFERWPLLLGHYRATLLTGTEKVINERIGGAMKHSLDLGVYPVAPGTHQVFLNNRVVETQPWLIPRPKAVIVAGLGEEGKLQGAALAYTVRQAVIAWAQRVAEQSNGEEEWFDLATTLMGSGGSGVTAGQAAQLIAQGVHDANELLKDKEKEKGDRGWPRVRNLRLIELYLDRASEAWRALKMLSEATPERYTLTDGIQTGTGPLQRPLDSGYRGADYDFITAQTRKEQGSDASIEFALDTKRARTEVRAQATQSRLLRELVATASSDQNIDPQIGRTLFKLLVPIDLEPFLSGTNDMQIELDPGTAGIPWELLDDSDPQSNKQPWAIRAKLLRKLRTAAFRDRVTDADALAHALVIGEPECPPGYQRLYGAREEAEEVFKCLVGGLDGRVTKLFSDDPTQVGSDARTVINALLERDWRIVHVAGHGAPTGDDGKPGGVVLSNGTFLGPNEIEAMRVVPELVFVNCCHLGAWANETVLRGEAQSAPTAYDRARFASGVAEKLINIGVRCVVAAGWAVDDEAAKNFATTFYTSLLGRNRFIDAVSEARKKAYETEGNTWAAYQCYGDPDWKLQRDTDDTKQPVHASPGEFDGIVSVTGLKLALETLWVQTKFQQYEASYQLERVAFLEKRWEKMKWGASDGVAELFAQVYAAAGDPASAIEWYDEAIQASDGNVSFRALEQRGNLLVRQAWRGVTKAGLPSGRGKRPGTKSKSGRAGRGPATGSAPPTAVLDSARKVIHDAEALFDELAAFHTTAERENLCGSAMKRLAQIEAAAGRRAQELDAIEQMKRHYKRAEDIIRRDQLPDFYYPATNRIAADLALHAGERGWKGLDRGLLEATRESLRVKNHDDPDFWSIVGDTDLDLYEAVAAGGLAKEAESLTQRYDELHARMRGGSEWGSVYDTAEFVLSRYMGRTSPTEREAAGSILKKLKTLAAVG